MLQSLLCIKQQRQLRPRGGTLSQSYTPSKRNKLRTRENGDVLVGGLFQPLKTRADPNAMNCFRKDDARMEDVFSLQKRIGKGGFSEVWLAKYHKKPKEDPVAVKLMEKGRVPSYLVVNEMSVLKTVHNCPFAVQMTSKFQTATHYAIVMKYATGGTLNDRVKIVRRFSELVARFYAAEIAEGLFGLHNRGIIHRDLTLDNILIGDNGHVILSDFGLSLLRDTSEINVVCEPWADAAKAQFPAPELLLGKEYDKTVDWWCYGFMLYRMVVGEYPFMKSKTKESSSISSYSLEKIYGEEPYPNFLSNQVKSLISLLLARRKEHRLGRGAFEESDVTDMEFFFNVDWCQLRDHSLPAPFSDMVAHGQHSGQGRSKKQLFLPTTHMTAPTTPATPGPGGK